MPDNKHYQSGKHRRWREKVLRRDRYLCTECLRYGRKTPATHAHHIKPVETYPELAYDLDNGRSLCGACHNKLEPRTLSRRD